MTDPTIAETPSTGRVARLWHEPDDGEPSSKSDRRPAREDNFARLRSIIVGPEQREIVALRAHMHDAAARTHDVSRVLPDALQLRARDPQLMRALAPSVEQAITASVRNDPQPLADALFPVIGPAIRKAVAHTFDAMIDSIDVDIPQTLIDDETEHRVAHAKERAERAGLTLEEVLQAQGWDEDRLREDSRDHAIRAIKADLALEGVARAEKIEVDADDLGAEISSLAEAYGRDPKELAKQLERSGQIVTLAGDIIRGKALDLLVERAEIEPEQGDAAGGGDEPAAEPQNDTSDEVEETT